MVFSELESEGIGEVVSLRSGELEVVALVGEPRPLVGASGYGLGEWNDPHSGSCRTCGDYRNHRNTGTKR